METALASHNARSWYSFNPAEVREPSSEGRPYRERQIGDGRLPDEKTDGYRKSINIQFRQCSHHDQKGNNPWQPQHEPQRTGSTPCQHWESNCVNEDSLNDQRDYIAATTARLVRRQGGYLDSGRNRFRHRRDGGIKETSRTWMEGNETKLTRLAEIRTKRMNARDTSRFEPDLCGCSPRRSGITLGATSKSHASPNPT